MSEIDERVVILEFNNGQFETGVKESLSTLDKLKKSLNFSDSSKGLEELQAAGKRFSLSNVADNIETVADRFSTLGIIGDQVLRRLTDSAFNFGKNLLLAVPNQIISGGKRRAQNIEHAQFMLEGLLGAAYDWEKIKVDLNEGVSGTAYGLDEAASAAAQLAASNVEFGEEMQAALRGISGVAAMTGDSYGSIAQIFTKIAGQGRIMTEELNQFATHGINVAATMAEQFGMTEAELRAAVKAGEVDFQMFSYAMDDAFGKHAKDANKTFTGALSNVKAALSRMGEQFATPVYDNLRRILVALIPVLNDVKKMTEPLAAGFKNFAESVAGAGEALLHGLHYSLSSILGIHVTDFRQQLGGVALVMDGVGKEAKGVINEMGADLQNALNPPMPPIVTDKGFSAPLEQIAKTNKELEKAQEIEEAVNKARKDIEDTAAQYIKDGKDEVLVNKEKAEALATLDGMYEDYMANLNGDVDGTKKQNKFQQMKNKLLEKASGVVGGLGHKFMQLIGLEKTETQVLADEEQYNTVVQELAEKGIQGLFGNGEERVKALEDMGAAYSIVQNKINELLGCEKRHEVSAEDEAEMMAYVAETLGISSEQATVVSNVFEKLSSVAAGFLAVFDLIRVAASAFFTEIVQPFLSWGVPIVLNAILTPLSWIGDKLVEIYNNATSGGGLVAYFANLRERIVTFWNSVKELEGVKKLQEAWGKFKTTLKDLWSNVVTKVTGAFTNLQQTMKLPDSNFFLDIIGKITTKLSEFVDWIGGHIGVVADFFSPFFDWIVAIPPKLQEFWESIGGFAGIKSYFQPLIDWFAGIIDVLKDFWGALFGSKDENGEDVAGFFSPVADWFGTLQTKIENFINQAKQFTNIKDLFDWLITKVQTKIKNFWSSLWGNKDGEEAAKGAFSIGDAFEWLKTKISGFMDMFGPLKAVKEWLKGIFNENLINSIKDIGTAIGDFFTSLFGKKEGDEAKTSLDSFSDRFLAGAETLSARLSEIFGANSSLGKLLAGGGIGLGLMTLLKLIGMFRQQKTGGGIAGALFGGVGGMISVPKIVAAILGLGAALKYFTSTSDTAQQAIDGAGDMFSSAWQQIQSVVTSAFQYLEGNNIFGSIYDFIFGTKNKGEDEGENQVGGLIETAKTRIQTAFTSIGNFIAKLTGTKEFGLTSLLNLGKGGLIGFGIFKLISGIVALLKGVGGLITGNLPILKDISNTMEAYQKSVRADLIMSIAKAIGIFALSIIGLCLIPTDRLQGVITGLIRLITAIGLIAIVITAISRFKTKDAPNAVNTLEDVVTSIVSTLASAFKKAATFAGIGLLFLGIGAAIGILVFALTKLATIPDLDKPMKALGELFIFLGLFAGAMIALSKWGGGSGTKMGGAIFAIGASLLALAFAIKMLEGTNVDVDLVVGMIQRFTVLIGLLALMGGSDSFDLDGIGAELLKISASLLILAFTLKMLSGVKTDGDAFIGMIEWFTLFIAALSFLNGNENFDLEGIGDEMIKLAASLLILGAAVAFFGLTSGLAYKAIGPLIITLAILLGFLWGFQKLELADTFSAISESLMQFAAGIIVLSFALPLLANGLVLVGKVILENIKAAAVGLGAFIGVLAILITIAHFFAPELIILTAVLLGIAAAILVLAVAVGLIYSIINGFDVVGTIIGSVFGDQLETIGSMTEGINGLIESFQNLASAASSALGLKFGSDEEEEPPEYTGALENYKIALGNMDFLDDSVRTQLAEKMEGLKELDGSMYSIELQNVMAYIRNLDLDEQQTARVLRETAAAAEQQQKEEFTLVCHKIHLILDQHGVSPEQQAEIDKHLAAIAQLKKGSISLIVDDVHYMIANDPNITEEGKDEIGLAFDRVVTSHIKYRAAVRELQLYLSNNTSLTVEGMAIVQEQLDNMESREEFRTNLEKLLVFIDDAEVDDPENVKRLLETAVKQKQAVDTEVGLLNATIGNVVVGEEAQADLKSKVNTAINNLTAALETEGEEDNVAAYAEIDALKAEITGASEATISKEGKKSLLEQVGKAVSAVEKYHAAVNSLEVEVLKLLPDEKRKAFKELWNALVNSDTYNEAEVEKLWVTCNNLGMGDDEIRGLLDQLGVVLDEGFNKAVELHNLHFVLDKHNVSQETKDKIDEEILAMMGLDPDKDSEEFELHRTAAVDLMLENGMTREEANALIEEYTGEAEDAKTAKLSLLSVLVENATFATDAEKQNYLTEIGKMYDLYGQPLVDEIEKFKTAVLEKSSLQEGEKTLIVDTVEEVGKLAVSAYSDLYDEVLTWEEKLRRKDYIGAYLVDTVSEAVNGVRPMITNGSVIATEFAKFFKDFDGEISDEQLVEFAEHVSEMGYSWEQIAGSFKNIVNPLTGQVFANDDEIINFLFPNGTINPLSAPMLREIMRPFAKSFSDGSSQALQHELSRYGKLNWGEALEYEGDWTINPARGTKTSYADVNQQLDDELKDMEDIIKEHRHEKLNKEFVALSNQRYQELHSKIDWTKLSKEEAEQAREQIHKTIEEEIGTLGEYEGDKLPLTFEDIYDYLYGDENEEGHWAEWEGAFGEDSPLIAYMEKIHKEAEASGNEAEYLAQISEKINATLYKSGDGVEVAAVETTEQIKEAYETLTEEQKTQLDSLRAIFDPDGKYKTDIDFYGFLRSAFGGLFSLSGDADFDIEEALGMEGGLTNYLLDKLTDSIQDETISYQSLAALYKEFPDFREIVQAYYRDHPEKKVDPEYQHNLDREMNEYYQAMNEALEKAKSSDQSTMRQGQQELHDIFTSGEVDEATIKEWLSESPEFSGILEKYAKDGIEDIDVDSITSDLFDQLSTNTSLGGTFGDWLGGNFGDWFSDLKFGLPSDQVGKAGETIGNQVLDAADAATKTIGTDTGKNLDEALGTSLVDNAGAATAGMTAVTTLLKGAGEDDLGIASPSRWAIGIGEFIIEGLVYALEKGQSRPSRVFREIVRDCTDKIRAMAVELFHGGVEVTMRLAEGIVSEVQAVYSAMGSLIDDAAEGARSREYIAEELGRYFGEGYVRGIDSMRQAAYEGGAALAAEAEQGNRDASGTNSPSRVARSLGNFFGMGYVNGMLEFSKKVHDTAGDLATTAIDTLRNPMQLVQNLLDSDLESDPTITPVMDLSNIQNGVRRINGMMPDTGINLGYISSSMNRVRTTNEDVVAAISGLSRQMDSAGGNVYNVNGVTYDDGTNIATAVQDLVRAARVERRR